MDTKLLQDATEGKLKVYVAGIYWTKPFTSDGHYKPSMLVVYNAEFYPFNVRPLGELYIGYAAPLLKIGHIAKLITKLW